MQYERQTNTYVEVEARERNLFVVSCGSLSRLTSFFWLKLLNFLVFSLLLLPEQIAPLFSLFVRDVQIDFNLN